jgi:hypothetical protein
MAVTEREGQMDGTDRQALARQLAAVIAWEIEAQAGVQRPTSAWPMLIADSVLDYFEVQLLPGVTLPS